MDIKIQFDLYSMDCDTQLQRSRGTERDATWYVISLIVIYEISEGD